MDDSSEARPEDTPEKAPSAPSLISAGRRRGVTLGSRAMQPGEATPQLTCEGPADTEGVPRQLADMRWVYAHPACEDRTPGHKLCRKWLKADLPGFMARKSSLEAKVPIPKPRDDRYAFRLELDHRRCDQALNHGEMFSLLIFVDGTDEAFELYVTLDEWTAWRDTARAAGLSLPDWLLGKLDTYARQTLAALPGGGAFPQGDS
jgi:hypothetical protein